MDKLQKALEIIEEDVTYGMLAIEYYKKTFAQLEPVEYGYLAEQATPKRVECVDKIGGENCGSQYFVVLSVQLQDEKVLVRFEGYYDSWSGIDWYGDFNPKIVNKVLKTIEIYE